MYQVPGTGYRQTDVVYMWSPVFVVSVSYEKHEILFFFLARSIRNYTCLRVHDSKRGHKQERQKTPFLNPPPKSIGNGLINVSNITYVCLLYCWFSESDAELLNRKRDLGCCNAFLRQCTATRPVRKEKLLRVSLGLLFVGPTPGLFPISGFLSTEEIYQRCFLHVYLDRVCYYWQRLILRGVS